MIRFKLKSKKGGIKLNKKDLKQKVESIMVIVVLVCSGLLIFIPTGSKTSIANDTPSSTERYDNDFINGTIDNVTVIKTCKGNELRLDVYEDCTWLKLDPLTKPAPRDDQMMAAVHGTDKIVLYGGRDLSGRFGDTWIYDQSDNTWTEKFPVIDLTNDPGSRDSSAMAPIWGTDKVIIFGGLGISANDTWIYDLSDNNWTKKYPVNKPNEIQAHSMTSIYGTDKVLLFGGIFIMGGIYSNETWIYDLSDNNWTLVTTDPTPDARAQYGMSFIYNTDKVLLFGGGFKSGPSYLNDTWVYDLSEGNWTKIIVPISPKPTNNAGMAAIYRTDKIVIFSGYFHNETWVYDLSENTWTQKLPVSPPTWRANHRMVSVFRTNKIILFGGSTPFTNETWEFKLLNYFNKGSYISPPYYIGSNASYKSISWNGSVATNTSIKFQFRTANSELELNSKPFVGFDGSPGSYYTISPSSNWPGHNNQSWMQYKAYLSTRNYNETPILRNVSIINNYWPNTTLVDPNYGSIKVDNRPSFEWNFSDRDSIFQEAFQVLIDDDIEFKSIDFNSSEQSSQNYTWQFPNGTSYNKLPDGSWYWKVRTKDNDGDWGLYSSPWKIIIDTLAPNSIIINPKNNRYYNSLDIISGLAYEGTNSTGIDVVEIIIKNLNKDRFWNGFEWTSEEIWLLTNGTKEWSYDSSSVTWNSGSQYYVQSQATDDATNVEIPRIGEVFTIDMEEPVFSNAWPLITDESSTEDVEVGITISDSISGVNASTIQYAVSYDKGGIWDSWKTVEGLNDRMDVIAVLDLSFPNGTNNRIKWRAKDLVGNGPNESSAYIVNINTWRPPAKVQLLNPENGSIIQTNSVKLSWMLENWKLRNVIYDVYLDTVNPPTIVNQSGVINTSLIIVDLINGETYFWTVIPRIGSKNGTCISGVWSFTVNIPSPSVILISPANSSTISSRTPTLMWSLEYEGTAKVKYEVYFENNMEPELLHNGYPTTYFSPLTILEYNTTYYWQIVPNASGIKGPPSELWSFKVEQEDYSQYFELNLTLEPAVIELMPDEKKHVKAIVTNLGNLTNTISLRIWVPADTRVSAMVNEPNIMDASPKGIAEFDITVLAFEDAEQNEISLRVVAISEIAPEYNLTAVKETELIVKIKIIDMDTEKHEPDKSSSLEGNWYFLFIVIIIILILIILAIIIIRKKRNDNELPSGEIVTAKSVETLILEIITKQVPTTSAPVHPGTATTPVGDTPQLAASTTTTTVPVPKLVKSTQTAETAPTIQASAQVQQLQVPQLPPAKVQIQTPVQTPVVTTPTPQVAQLTPETQTNDTMKVEQPFTSLKTPIVTEPKTISKHE